MFARRIGRPGLVGTAARTAVIAGTATATANAVGRRQATRAEQRAEAQAYEQQQHAQQQYAQQQYAQQPAPVAPAGDANGGLGDQLAKLADLHQRGLLSDEEFTAAKQRLLG